MADNVSITEGNGKTIAADDIGGVLHQRVKIGHGADGSATDVSTSSPLPAQLRDSDGTDVALSGKLGALTETAPSTDTASSGLNGRLQRIAQRLTSLIALLPASLGANGGLKIEGVASGTTVPVTEASAAAIAASASVLDDWDESDRAKVNPIVGQAGIAAGAGAVGATVPRVTLASDDPGVAHLATIAGDTTDIEAAVELIDDTIVADDAAFTPGTTKVAMAGYQADEASTDSVDEGDAGAARMTLDRKLIVQPQPHTAGGLSIFRSLDLDETEEEIKATAGQVYGFLLTNRATSARYLKFYNATAANVTVGTTTPVITWPIPANSTDFIAAAALGAMGIAFDTAITVAATTGLADNDTGAPGANDVVINVFYK